MTRQEFNDAFADSIERERHLLKMTQQEMADYLGISLSVYKRMINGQVEKIDAYMTYKMYVLTQKLAYELVGYNDNLVNTMTKLRDLDAEELRHVNELIRILERARGH